jgi:hypothetical protein
LKFATNGSNECNEIVVSGKELSFLTIPFNLGFAEEAQQQPSTAKKSSKTTKSSQKKEESPKNQPSSSS